MKRSDGSILWIAPGDPWSQWNVSGITRDICFELKRRGILYGAIHPGTWTRRHLHGPGPFYSLEAKMIKKLCPAKRRHGPWLHESEGVVGTILRECPPDTPVIYTFLTPEIDASLSIRRFRFMDLSLSDAIRTGSYHHSELANDAIRRKRAQQQKMLDAAEGVVTLSTHAADAIARDFGYPRNKITPIGAGPSVVTDVAIDGIDRYEAARILFVGRAWERKGGDVLVEAYRSVRQAIPHATLTIVGPDRLPTVVQGINFVGPLNKSNRAQRRQLQQIFSTSSVFCMPSLCETWGLVYVEAARAGLPIVGFFEWALPDIVVDGVTGRLTRERSAEGLAETLIQLLAEPHQMMQMGQLAHQRVCDVLDWPHVIDRLLSRVMPMALGNRNPVPLHGSQ